MFNMIFSILIIIILWYIAFDCNSKLSNKLSKPVILIFTSVIYFLLIMIYTYCNLDHCYNHISLLDFELVYLLLLVPIITIVINLMFIHAQIPKVI